MLLRHGGTREQCFTTDASEDEAEEEGHGSVDGGKVEAEGTAAEARGACEECLVADGGADASAPSEEGGQHDGSDDWGNVGAEDTVSPLASEDEAGEEDDGSVDGEEVEVENTAAEAWGYF